MSNRWNHTVSFAQAIFGRYSTVQLEACRTTTGLVRRPVGALFQRRLSGHLKIRHGKRGLFVLLQMALQDITDLCWAARTSLFFPSMQRSHVLSIAAASVNLSIHRHGGSSFAEKISDVSTRRGRKRSPARDRHATSSAFFIARTSCSYVAVFADLACIGLACSVCVYHHMDMIMFVVHKSRVPKAITLVFYDKASGREPCLPNSNSSPSAYQGEKLSPNRRRQECRLPHLSTRLRLPRTMANWAIQPGEEDESTWLMVGEFSSMKIRGAADLAVTEWNVTVSETGRWVDHI